MNFPGPVSTTGWVTLLHQGEEIAEAWVNPEGERYTVVFLVPHTALTAADTTRRVTIETLLMAAAISKDDVESWRLGDDSDSIANLELDHPLPLPPPDEAHLAVYAVLKSSPTVAGDGESDEQNLAPEQWQAIEVTWKTILGLEASVDACRLSMESLRAEMEGEFRRSLHVDEKLNALQSDIVQWNKAKTRVHYCLPKAREFIHRATWATAAPERKRLEELFRAHIEPRKPFPELGRFREQLEHLQKDRQLLFAQGNAVTQECRGVLGEIQRALGTLQRNAADRARQKRSTGREKGKHF